MKELNYENSKSTVFRVFLFALILGTCSLTSFAQGFSYVFPGITTNNQITIGNINTQPASVVINFYSSSGNINTVTVDLAPGQQTRANPATVSLTNFTGSVVITSPVPLAASADQFEGATAFDFVYPSQVGTNLLIPFLPISDASADVNVFNPGPNQAEVKVALVQSDGTHTTSRTATIDPLHTTTISLSTSSNVSYAVVTTENILRPLSPVAASATLRSFNTGVSGAVPRTDIAVVPAVLNQGFTKTTEVPFFTQGPDYFALVQIVNLSSAQQTLLVSAKQADGTPVPGTNNPASIVLPPYGSVRQEMATMFGSTATSFFATGTLTATSQGTRDIHGNPTGGPPALLTMAVAMGNISEPGLAVMLPSPAQTRFALHLRGTDRGFFTGLSLLNEGSADAHASLTFVLDQGTNLSTVPITVPHGSQKIGTLADLFPEAVGNGYILVTSDVPITVVGLDGRQDNSALAPRVPVYAAANFVPPPQQSFLIVGTVRDTNSGINGQNIGVPNVALALNGPVQLTTATDLAGTFLFRDLQPGTYTLTPLPIGFTASPPSSTIQITNSNSRVNDFAIGVTPPGILTINPASALQVSAGPTTAANVQITVQGSNFIEPTTFAGNIFIGNINKFTTGTTMVFLDSQVPTSVSSPTLLVGSVNSNLLVTTGIVDVKVRNLGPSGDFADSPPLQFTIGTAPPLLTSVTGVPNPLVAGHVTAPFTVTVNGSGFTPATVVRVNFVNRPTTYVNQNQVMGTVLPSDLTIPGQPVPITVQNPNTVDSTPFNLSVFYPIPVITQMTPSSITAQLLLTAQPLPITLTGTDFSQSPTNPLLFAQVYVNGSPVPTIYTSTTQVQALIPPNFVAVPGVLQVAVVNPAPSIAPSNAVPLFVNNPIATITSADAGHITWNPNSPPLDFFNATVVITGNNFSPDAVVWYTPPCDNLGIRRALSTMRNSSTQIVGTILVSCSGNYSVAVANPQPGGGLSAPANINVPSVAASKVIENKSGPVLGIKSDQVAAVNPSPSLAAPNNVTSPSPGPVPSGNLANPNPSPSPSNNVATPSTSSAPSIVVPLAVNNPVALITSADAGNITWNPGNTPDFFDATVVITGNNFLPDAVVWYTPPCDKSGIRSALSTTRNSSTEIVATIRVSCSGNYSIAVANPQAGGGLSDPATLNVPPVASKTVIDKKSGPVSGSKVD
jgi:hypothetical protein